MAHSTDPFEALDAVRRTDRKMAQRMHWPLWRHAAAGLLQAIFVFIWATPMPFAAVLMALSILAIFAIVESDKRNHGMFVSGWASKGARPAVLATLAITVLGFAAIAYASGGINTWTPFAIPIALAVFAGSTLCSLWWERLYRRELSDDGAGR